ncbi:MAG: NAD(P)H-dependent oxidoreductase subunit E [Anaerolineae bacterium]
MSHNGRPDFDSIATAEPKVDLSPFQTYLNDVAPRGRQMLLPALHKAQELYGWLPREVQEAISIVLRIPLADIHGVIEFYSMFYSEPTAKRVIRVCEDPACSLGGSDAIIASLQEKLGLQHGETADDRSITFEKVPCLGMCELAPVALNGEKPAGNLSVADVDAFLDGSYPEPTAIPYGEERHLLKRVGKIDPMSMADYLSTDGYKGLDTALAMSPEDLIKTVESFGILGRGGAMFPLGRKWLFTRGAPGPASEKHVVVNADESEPGTFKDRCLMEEDPFALIEAMTIAAYGVGAENGWIFVRGEYPRSFARLNNAVDEARKAGKLGQNIGGKKGFTFDIEVRLGAGAYICGEETALFEAIEGKRGFPRIKPPFPTTHGLFFQPTSANNVETLVAMLHALNMGVDKWRSYGTEQSPGTKLYCVSGQVEKPGIYELPFGATGRELLAMAGGVAGSKSLKAVLMGGAAGVFIDDSKLDYPLTYEGSRDGDFPLGSGVFMVFDEDADIRRAMFELARFFAHESCGKCFPCQLGSQRQMEILDRVAHPNKETATGTGPQSADKQILLDVGFTMTETSLCGLGQTAGSAVMSAIELWPEILEEGK